MGGGGIQEGGGNEGRVGGGRRGGARRGGGGGEEGGGGGVGRWGVVVEVERRVTSVAFQEAVEWLPAAAAAGT